MKKAIATTAMGLTLALVGCTTTAPETADTSSALVIDVHSDTAIEGTFTASDRVVTFRADQLRKYVGSLSVEVGDATLFYLNDSEVGEIMLDGRGTSLTAADRDALVAFSHAVEAYIGHIRDADAMHETMLSGGSAYLAVAPVGMTLDTLAKPIDGFTKDTANGNGNDGKTCITVGTQRTAYFDQGSSGQVYSWTWTVGNSGGGSYGCMGRCGPGCGGGDWTLDCLDHDACSLYFGASGGGSDPNCGDEWWNGSDDYTNIFKRCYN